MAEDRTDRTLRRPTITDFVAEGEETPLLLQRRVLAGIAAAFLALVAVYFILTAVFDISLQPDPKPLQDWVEQWGVWGPIAFMAVMAFSVLFAPVPNAPIFIAAGLVWGPVLGSVYSMIGMMWGSAMAFWVARRLGRKYLPRLVGSKAAAQMDSLSVRMGGRLIFWARMLPVVNFDWISFLAGLTAMSFWRFFVFSFLGMLTPTIVGVVAGDSLGRDVRITLIIAGVWVAGVILSGLYFWWRRRQARAEAAPQAAEPLAEGQSGQ
ncbi:MAG: TVP38/TMEM64 family protein [Dehalococcoidia bacterium]|nr:TVP38/TMEM64 family protein [Dehalococcoidia bacterium]MYA52357.1 TVP38/TMEM64 family protein [Dehalococcoidia bacterium]